MPVVYQRNFAIGDRLTLHVDSKPSVPARVQNTATRGPFYRRTRPDGSEIDDIEASLSYIEAAVSPVRACPGDPGQVAPSRCGSPRAG